MGDVWGLLVDPVLMGVSLGPSDPAELAGDRVEAMVFAPPSRKGGVAVGFELEDRRFLGTWACPWARLELDSGFGWSNYVVNWR